jgi:murein DD-endopeptidase MepM/ murein hydrolase activator NlpD
VPSRPAEPDPDSRSAEAPAGDLPTTPRAFTLAWPVPAIGVNSLFGRRRDPIDGTVRYHAGVDLDAAYGGVVSAAADGSVSSAGWHAGHGRRVVLEHTGGYQTVYSHLSQLLAVNGTWVRAGQAIGRVGNSGRSTGPHLHFELNRWGEHLDPLDYLGRSIPLDGTDERRRGGGDRGPLRE